MMTTLRYTLEATAVVLLSVILRLLPLDAASWLGGFLARHIGPFLTAHKTAEKNLAMAFPEKSEAERKIIVRGMWDNLGRTAAEMPRLPGESLFKRMETHGTELFPAPGKSVLFVAGHLGNWELSYPVAHRHGVPIALVYRHANNPVVDKMVVWLRSTQSSNQFPKGHGGAVRLIRSLKDGQSLAMLVDQKLNGGIAVPFFGREAMTAPAVAQFALRYDMPIFAARVIRKGGAYFEWRIESVPYENTGDEKRDELVIMTRINALLETWIREYPEQWFWVHKRWPN
jgi:KDO2-lipid IV(A) lauroyltransferase